MTKQEFVDKIAERANLGRRDAQNADDAMLEQITETQAQLDTIRGTLFPSVPQRGAGSNEEHRELIELLERGDTFERIQTTAREHKLHFLQAGVRHLEEIKRVRNGTASIAQQQPRAGAV